MVFFCLVLYFGLSNLLVNALFNSLLKVNSLKTGVPYEEWWTDSNQDLDKCLNLVWQSFKTPQDSTTNLSCEDGLKFHNSCSLCQALELLWYYLDFIFLKQFSDSVCRQLKIDSSRRKLWPKSLIFLSSVVVVVSDAVIIHT